MKGRIFESTPNGFDRKSVLGYVENCDNEIFELQAEIEELNKAIELQKEDSQKAVDAVLAEFDAYKASVDASVKNYQALSNSNEALKDENERLKKKISVMEENQAQIFEKNSKLYEDVHHLTEKKPSVIGSLLKNFFDDGEKDKIIAYYKKQLAATKFELEQLKKGK